MNGIVNFDNSAGTFPKPKNVLLAAESALTRYGGNPGRGGHRLSVEAAEMVFSVRQSAAEFFGAEPENTVFTPNCTYALNMAIKGMMQFGGHIIISDHEHNAVLRPVWALAKTRGVTFSVARLADSAEETLENIRRLIRPDTKCVCVTCASNVTGRISPYREIAELCRSYGLCFISDAAQAAGITELTLDDGFDFLCTAGQKGLYGPTGTGLLVSAGRFELTTIIEGGTGTASADPEQPRDYPERFESGTVNTMGILGLGAGIEFVKAKTPAKIFVHEKRLCDKLEAALHRMEGVKVYTAPKRVPIVSLCIEGFDSQVVSARLSDKGFALRGGLHCAPLAHKAIGTIEGGTVRFSPSVFSTERQTEALISAIERTARELRA